MGSGELPQCHSDLLNRRSASTSYRRSTRNLKFNQNNTVTRTVSTQRQSHARVKSSSNQSENQVGTPESSFGLVEWCKT